MLASEKQPAPAQGNRPKLTRANQNILTFIHIPKTGGTSVNKALMDSPQLEYVNIVNNNIHRDEEVARIQADETTPFFASFHPAILFPDSLKAPASVALRAMLHKRAVPFTVARRPSSMFSSFVRYYWDMRHRNPDYWGRAVEQGIYPNCGDPNEVFRELIADGTSRPTRYPGITNNIKDGPIHDLCFFSPTLSSYYGTDRRITYRDVHDALNHDYVYLAAIEHLDALIEFFAQAGLLPSGSRAMKLNTSTRTTTSPLNPEYARIIDEDWSPWSFTLWHRLNQGGPGGNHRMIDSWVKDFCL